MQGKKEQAKRNHKAIIRLYKTIVCSLPEVTTKSVNHGIIHNHRKWKGLKRPSTDEDKSKEAHSAHGPSFRNKKERSSDTCYNVDET